MAITTTTVVDKSGVSPSLTVIQIASDFPDVLDTQRKILAQLDANAGVLATIAENTEPA